MNKSESKYFNTAVCMDVAFLELLDKKDFDYITVTEICKKAGVNRSTFYLHYENITDLLNESVEYINNQFISYFANESKLDVNNIETIDIKELYLITPQYLMPFLQFIKDHRRLFKTIMQKSDVLGTDNRFKILFNKVFSPIMDRYRVPENKKLFLISFTVNGIMGVINVWLENDCSETVEFISDIIVECFNQSIVQANKF